jgi:NAD(P)H dehydrogenase (quinone)
VKKKMATLVIIYDSKTGNTEKMAKSIADGAKSVSGVNVIVKKLGEPFSLRILDDADAIVLGAPAHYGHVTSEMRDFLAYLRDENDARRLEFKGKIGAAFGSYGWDGGMAIERLALDMENLGIKVQSRVLAQVPPLPYPSLKENFLKECRELGKTLAKKISKQ